MVNKLWIGLEVSVEKNKCKHKNKGYLLKVKGYGTWLPHRHLHERWLVCLEHSIDVHAAEPSFWICIDFRHFLSQWAATVVVGVLKASSEHSRCVEGR